MLRKIKRKFGIAAPRVAVRTHVPWYWRWGSAFAFAAVVFVLAWWAYDIGTRFAGFNRGEADRELARLTEAANHLEGENTSLRQRVIVAEQQLKIERATHEDLAKQVKSLTDEDALLKEDLAFFQTLMSTNSNQGALTIDRFKVQHDELPGEYRYRLLIVRTRQHGSDFQGNLQFIANVVQGGKKRVITLPGENSKDAQAYRLNFKFYQRVEGMFQLAPDVVVQSVQVRVYENGVAEPKLTQTVNLS